MKFDFPKLGPSWKKHFVVFTRGVINYPTLDISEIIIFSLAAEFGEKTSISQKLQTKNMLSYHCFLKENGKIKLDISHFFLFYLVLSDNCAENINALDFHPYFRKENFNRLFLYFFKVADFVN